eukprot:6428227-Pyramimonas_sp.AAC.1
MPDKKAPLFDARGNKLLHRHMEANPRQLGGAACVCAKRILEKGVMSRFRGPMIAIQVLAGTMHALLFRMPWDSGWGWP